MLLEQMSVQTQMDYW